MNTFLYDIVYHSEKNNWSQLIAVSVSAFSGSTLGYHVSQK